MKARAPDLLFEDLHRQSLLFSPTEDRKKAEAMFGQVFGQQADFIQDGSRFKSVLCPRRAGKSFAAAVYMIMTMLLKPGSTVVFATLTQKSGRGILWNLLKQLDSRWELGAGFHNTNVTMTLPNRSTLSICGADSRGEIDKFRGQAYDLFVLDECKSFPPRVITELVDQVVSPALSDTLGTIVLMGTPGNSLKGIFYDSTRPNSTIARKFGKTGGRGGNQWSFHTWTTKENIKMPHIWRDQLAMKERNGWGDDNPIWLREYCAQWVADDDAFVYKFDPTRNSWQPEEQSDNEFGLPSGHEWQFVLGCDFGWEDPFAMVVSAFSDTHPDLFQVYSFKERHMHVADIARKIAEATDMFGEFSAMVGDSGGMGRMVIEELGSIYGIAMEAAEKTQKRDYIELLNSDLVEGRIKVLGDSDLVDEWQALVWKDGGRDKENKSFANHLADSFLYSWRYCYHHFFQDRVIEPTYGSAEYWEMKNQQAMEAALWSRQSRQTEDVEYFNNMERTVCDDEAFDEDGDLEEAW